MKPSIFCVIIFIGINNRKCSFLYVSSLYDVEALNMNDERIGNAFPFISHLEWHFNEFINAYRHIRNKRHSATGCALLISNVAVSDCDFYYLVFFFFMCINRVYTHTQHWRMKIPNYHSQKLTTIQLIRICSLSMLRRYSQLLFVKTILLLIDKLTITLISWLQMRE